MERNVVALERVILENPNLREDRLWFKEAHEPVHKLFPVAVPNGATSGVAKEVFDAYANGCAKACVDVVICTTLEDGRPAVLGLMRKPGTPYAGTWYMPGGALFAYMSISAFLAGKAEKECGHKPQIETIIGVYRNDAEDVPTSVISPCYVATVPVSDIRNTKPADGHDQWQLFTLEDLDNLPEEQTHWYPMHVWRRVLETMP